MLTQTAVTIPFPQTRRIGKIRDVASKMIAKPTDRAAASYRDQVNEAMIRQMTRAGIDETTQDEQLSAFWSAVQAEIIRIFHRGDSPGGHAA
ncbi:MAG: hypothetical protein EOR60_15165 [Mesorhizobium sp.]|nr:MAG: hypothetical protein EOR60_15165 [Mesorhizobium sp.]